MTSPCRAVHFHGNLLKPPPDRWRRPETIYPAVAQSKDSSGRRESLDLFWRWNTLSAVTYEFPAEGPVRDRISMAIVQKTLRAYHQDLIDRLVTTTSKLSSASLGHDGPRYVQSDSSQGSSASSYICSSSAATSGTESG